VVGGEWKGSDGAGIYSRGALLRFAPLVACLNSFSLVDGSRLGWIPRVRQRTYTRHR
jgi:hypothetical protein